jgi:hypothetical protein
LNPCLHRKGVVPSYVPEVLENARERMALRKANWRTTAEEFRSQGVLVSVQGLLTRAHVNNFGVITKLGERKYGFI